jgi:hypothetical protein
MLYKKITYFLVMNPLFQFNHQQLKSFRVSLFIGAFLLMLLTTSCVGFLSPEAEPTPVPILGTVSEQPLIGTGVLTCNQACADQAQCGTTQDLGPVVLLNSAGPSLDSHNLIVGTNFQADIQTHMDVEVQRNGDGPSQSMRFYKVAVRVGDSDRGEAWVAGWCIQQ